MFVHDIGAGNPTGYNLKQAASNGVYTTVGTNVPVASHNVSGLSNGIVYYFVVSATNSLGERANSAAVSVRPVSLTPSPLGLAFSDGLHFSWPSDPVGWRLEMQSHAPGIGIGTNWVTVSGSANINQIFIPFNPAAGSVFFRLGYP